MSNPSASPSPQPSFPSVQPTGGTPTVVAVRRPRWQQTLFGSGGAALLLAALAVALLLVFALTGSAPAATEVAYRYVPADAAFAAEVRLDLPGDQRDELVDFATGLPGFDGELAVFEQIDALLSDAVEEIGGPDADYARDVEPWFEGWMVMAGPPESLGGDRPSGLLILGVGDRAAAETAMPRLRGEGSWVAEEHRGTTLWTRGGGSAGDGPAAYAVLDEVLIVAGDAAELRAALDAGSGESAGLLDEPAFASSWRALPEGRLMAFWADAAAADELPMDLSELPFDRDLPDRPLPTGQIEIFAGKCGSFLPQAETVSGALLVRDGRGHLEMRTVYLDGAELPANADRRLADRLPADTFAYVEGDLGHAGDRLAACLDGTGLDAEDAAELRESLETIDQAIGWAGAGAFAARWDGSRLGMGAIAMVEDRAAAEAAVADLRSHLADGEHGPVRISETSHAGVTVVEARFEEDTGDDASDAAPEPVLAWALTSDVVIVGVDGAFVRAVLDTATGAGLRSDAAFQAAINAAGGFGGAGAAYLDVPTAMAVHEALDLGDGSDERHDLAGLASSAMVSRVDGDAVLTRVVASTLR